MSSEKAAAPLKKYVWSLVVLNFLDGLLTYIGLSTGAINEGNPLLASLSPFALLATKLFLSLCLFGFLFTPFIKIQSRIWRVTLVMVNILYSVTLLLHLYWLVILVAITY
ncbi:DUF5658 family protein [Planococcus donghaensis]|uniref:DUF5658 domain-containing protein n=1 Tax=Planococcus donghaensis TaxID=414778 RepID=A0A1C7ELX0_9BACL|nr:DUF5658 family protein [Planococcus donghaensis]ANU24322.1 hypothetical protein BCM40_13640 [Planococcus donghaensis]